MGIVPIKPKVVLQASFKYDSAGVVNQMVFDKMNGERACEYQVQVGDHLSRILARLQQEHGLNRVEVVLPSAHLMRKVVSQRPLTTLADVCKLASSVNPQIEFVRKVSKISP